jgi:hypothetical protein
LLEQFFNDLTAFGYFLEAALPWWHPFTGGQKSFILMMIMMAPTARRIFMDRK